jgi:hypothetical protein
MWFLDPRKAQPEVSTVTLRSTWHSILSDAARHAEATRVEALLQTIKPEDVVVREVFYSDTRRGSYFLVGARGSETIGVMAVFRRDGTLDAFVTAVGPVLDSFLQADDRTLICVPRYGDFQPFVRDVDKTARPVLKRLADGFEIDAG